MSDLLPEINKRGFWRTYIAFKPVCPSGDGKPSLPSQPAEPLKRQGDYVGAPAL